MPAPKLDDYVHAFKTASAYIDATVVRQRAPLKQRTLFTSAGKTVVHSQGERVIYGANGAMIARVTEDAESHNTHIEEDERLHAIVRPSVVRTRGRLPHPEAMAATSARPAPIRTALEMKGPR